VERKITRRKPPASSAAAAAEPSRFARQGRRWWCIRRPVGAGGWTALPRCRFWEDAVGEKRLGVGAAREAGRRAKGGRAVFLI
jgi:hypothetical protein